MLLITAIVRPEKTYPVMEALSASGYHALTRWDVIGRGKEKGIVVGNVTYEHMPKNMLYIVADEEQKNPIIDIIMETAKSGEEGCAGDGRIFVSPITEAYTISSSVKN